MKNSGNQSEAEYLRHKAEELLKKKPLKSSQQLSEVDRTKLIHELEIYQIELEMQNEELMLARSTAQKTAEKYTELYDFAPSGYFTLSREGKIIELNNYGANMLGRECKQLKNSSLGFFVSDDTKPILNLFLEEIFTTNARKSCELILTGEDNVTKYVYLIGIVSKNGGNCLINVIDITEQKLVEKSLLESEKRFRSLTESSPVGIFRTDAEGSTTYVNSCWCQISGLSYQEAMSDGWLAAIHSEDRDKIKNAWRIASSSHIISATEYRFVHANGEITWVMGHAVPEINSENQILGYVGTITDITERKQAEEALLVSQQLIEGIINAIPVRVFWKDRNLVYLGCNEIFACDAGFSDPKDLIGKDDFQMVWQEQAELYRADDYHVIETGSGKFNIEEPQTTPEGNIITLLTSKIPLRNSNGEVSGILGTYIDITERKKAEEALKEKMDELQRFHRLTIGRELTMIDLKKEVNELLKKSGQKEKYKIVE